VIQKGKTNHRHIIKCGLQRTDGPFGARSEASPLLEKATGRVAVRRRSSIASWTSLTAAPKSPAHKHFAVQPRNNITAEKFAERNGARVFL
jgi:hypothetical protein